MNPRATEQKITELLMRGQVQRLAAQIALIEARAQLEPARSTLALIGAAARMMSSSASRAPLLSMALQFTRAHPWLTSASVGTVFRWVKRRPLLYALAGGAGYGVWRLTRAPHVGSPADLDQDGAP